MGEVKDKSLVERLDDIKYKSPVQSNQELTDSKILGWLSRVAFTWEKAPKPLNPTLINKFVFPVFKKLAQKNPDIVRTYMNSQDFKILLSKDLPESEEKHYVSVGFNEDLKALSYDTDENGKKTVTSLTMGDLKRPGISIQVSKKMDIKDIKKLTDELYKEIIEMTHELHQSSQYQEAVNKKKEEGLKFFRKPSD